MTEADPLDVAAAVLNAVFSSPHSASSVAATVEFATTGAGANSPPPQRCGVTEGAMSRPWDNGMSGTLLSPMFRHGCNRERRESRRASTPSEGYL